MTLEAVKMMDSSHSLQLSQALSLNSQVHAPQKYERVDDCDLFLENVFLGVPCILSGK